MNEELERQEFEKWFRANYEGQMIKKGTGYSEPITQFMWQAWQARAKQESNHVHA